MERTWIMRVMSVTLVVSKLSGWLNDAALCRESNGGYAVRVKVVHVQAKARLQIQVRGAGNRGRCTRGVGLTEGWGPQGTRVAREGPN